DKYPGRFQRAEAVFRFVRDRVKYTPDIDQFDYEEFAQNADELASSIDQNGVGYGDCEDSAVLLAVMYKGAGFRSATTTETKLRTPPLIIRDRIGTRQKMGLRIKLSTRVEAFLIKINIQMSKLGRARILPNCSSRAARSSERRPAIPVGVTKVNMIPKTIPMPNKMIATKTHLL
ncbi:unnamed protein product, partial [marine sediment metagenome]